MEEEEEERGIEIQSKDGTNDTEMSVDDKKLREIEIINNEREGEDINEDSDDDSQVVEDDFLNMLLHSASEGESLFSSWEPRRQEQYYFLTTKSRAKRAEEWLDTTMNHLLTKYGAKECLRVFESTSGDMPRGETKVRLDSFIMDYIQTLNIGDEKGLNSVREG